ncbi:hypothetical protein E2C01_044226 [Portunus trituberculatus]|uniref:Uncharacterized protein n=1 Tax=Portunus trituberculatus TaxID=210409 RepID=A0A5B7FZU8_PORTR|nr:hypothetical protein [Portunus trituberculatus]
MAAVKYDSKGNDEGEDTRRSFSQPATAKSYRTLLTQTPHTPHTSHPWTLWGSWGERQHVGGSSGVSGGQESREEFPSYEGNQIGCKTLI